MLVLAKNRDTMHELNSMVIEKFSNELQTYENEKIFLNKLRIVYIPSITLLCLIIFFSSVGTISPGLKVLAQYLNGSDPIHYDLAPLYMSPFAVQNGGFIFYEEYFHLTSITTAIILGTGLDLLFVLHTFMLEGLLQLLASRVQNYRYDEEKPEGLKEIVKEHLWLTKRYHAIGNLYEIPIFALFASSSIIMCSGIYQVSQV